MESNPPTADKRVARRSIGSIFVVACAKASRDELGAYNQEIVELREGRSLGQLCRRFAVRETRGCTIFERSVSTGLP
jgi:hypothetical protein